MTATLLDDLRSTIAGGDAVVVVGAGLAMNATGCASTASWSGLLESGRAHCVEVVSDLPAGWSDRVKAEIESGDGLELIAAAEKITERLGGRRGAEFARWLEETVGSLTVRHPEAIDALADLGLVIATTNYDDLIEQRRGFPSVSWTDHVQVQRVMRRAKDGVLHLHGVWSGPESVVLGIRSYESVLADQHIQTVLRSAAYMRSLIFVGFGGGLHDPNFGALRAWMASTLRESPYRHFRLCPHDTLDDVRRSHDDHERIAVLPYPRDGLATFVGSLAPASAATPVAVLRFNTAREDGLGVAAADVGVGGRTALAASLPASRRCFGRDDLVHDVVERVLHANDARPIAVTGGPGVGKSTMCLRVLHDPQIATAFGARRLSVACDVVARPAELVGVIASKLGLLPRADMTAAVLERLAEGPTLLVLDNLETLFAAEDVLEVEEIVRQIGSLPELTLICSSRGMERPGGVSWANPPVEVGPLVPEAARALFLDIAGPAYEASDPTELDALLAELDGVSLAIELLGCAAQTEPGLSALRSRWAAEHTAMLARADGNSRYLSAAVSFELSITSRRMTVSARRLLSVLALWPAGVRSDDVNALLPRGSSVVARLRAAGLVQDHGDRVRVLRPIAEHVRRERPAPDGDEQSGIDHFLALATQLGPRIRQDDGRAAIERLVAERANVDVAASKALESDLAGKAIEALHHLSRLDWLASAGPSPLLKRARKRAAELQLPLAEAQILEDLGTLSRSRSEYGVAQALFDEAIQLYNATESAIGQARCELGLGAIDQSQGRYEDAQTHFESVLETCRWLDARHEEGHSLHGLGMVHLGTNDLEAAKASFQQAADLYASVHEAVGRANCLHGLGTVAINESLTTPPQSTSRQH